MGLSASVMSPARTAPANLGFNLAWAALNWLALLTACARAAAAAAAAASAGSTGAAALGLAPGLAAPAGGLAPAGGCCCAQEGLTAKPRITKATIGGHQGRGATRDECAVVGLMTCLP